METDGDGIKGGRIKANARGELHREAIRLLVVYPIRRLACRGQLRPLDGR